MPLTQRTKKPGETRRYSMSFANYEEITDDLDTLTGTPTVTSTPVGLTTASPTISGSSVRFNASSGTLGQVYEVLVAVNTTGGFVLNGYGNILIVKED